MILDGALMFDNPSSLAIAAGSQNSANTIDLLNARDLGVETGIELFATVSTTFTSGGAATLHWSLVGSHDNSAYYTMLTSRVFALAELTAGSRLGMTLPPVPSNQVMPRYLRLVWTVATATVTAGAVIAGLVLTEQRNYNYPAGLTVSN